MLCSPAQPVGSGTGTWEGGPTLEHTSSCPGNARDLRHIVEQEVGVTGVSGKVGAVAEETPQLGGHCLIVQHNRLGADIKLVPGQGPVTQHAHSAGMEASPPAELEDPVHAHPAVLGTQGIKGYLLGRNDKVMSGQKPELLTETQEGQKWT